MSTANADIIQYDIDAEYSATAYHWTYRIDMSSVPYYTNIYTYSAGDVMTAGYAADFASLDMTVDGGDVQRTTNGGSIFYASLPPGHPNVWYWPPDYDPDPRPYGMGYEIEFRYELQTPNGPDNVLRFTLGMMLPSNYFDEVEFPFTPIAPQPTDISRSSANIHLWSGTPTLPATISVSIVPEPSSCVLLLLSGLGLLQVIRNGFSNKGLLRTGDPQTARQSAEP
jgi:hypothetical protein